MAMLYGGGPDTWTYRPAPSLPPAGSTLGKAQPPLHQLFDLLPICGSLEPGQSESVEVSFFAKAGIPPAAVTAVCHVEDGPDYQVGCNWRQRQTGSLLSTDALR